MERRAPPPVDYDDNPEWTDEDFARARPADEIHPPHVVAALVRKRGPQRAATKRQVTLRLDPDVLEKFRATGRGWQGRINAALRNVKIGRDDTEADAA